MTEEDALKSSVVEVHDNVTSQRPSLKSMKDEDKQGETAGMSSTRKRIKIRIRESRYGENLVGSKVKVWRPEEGEFNEGVIESFDYVKKKHRVHYDYGEVDILNLRKEQWEIIGDDPVSDGDAYVEHSRHDTSSDVQRKKNKERNTNSELSKSCKLKDAVTKSGEKLNVDGNPESEINVNNLGPSRNYVDDAAIKPLEHGGKSQGDYGKASGGNRPKDESTKTLSHVTKRDSQRSSAESKCKTPQSGKTKTLAKTSSSPKVKESGKTLPKTTSSSKGGEGNSIFPTECTPLRQTTQGTLRRLSRMLNEGIQTDVTIITSDGSLKAHKAILSASSLIFHSMFQHELREKVSTVEMKDMTSESCMALLSFLYGSLNQEAFLRHQLDLLGAASKYEIVDLKDACEQSLLEDINSGNVLERLQQAWLYKLDKLKKECSTYLLDSEKICGVGEVMDEFFRQADRGLLVEMFKEVLAIWKQN